MSVNYINLSTDYINYRKTSLFQGYLHVLTDQLSTHLDASQHNTRKQENTEENKQHHLFFNL